MLRDGDVVDGDGWSLEAVHTPGHATNHLCYLVLEEGALCTGDHVMGWATTVVSPPDGNLAEYLGSLEKLLDAPAGSSVPPGAWSGRSRTRTFSSAAGSRTASTAHAQVLEALATSPATIGELVPLLYADVAKEVWPAAAASVYAQLLHLEALGLVEARGWPDRATRASRVRCAR